MAIQLNPAIKDSRLQSFDGAQEVVLLAFPASGFPGFLSSSVFAPVSHLSDAAAHEGVFAPVSHLSDAAAHEGVFSPMSHVHRFCHLSYAGDGEEDRQIVLSSSRLSALHGLLLFARAADGSMKVIWGNSPSSPFGATPVGCWVMSFGSSFTSDYVSYGFSVHFISGTGTIFLLAGETALNLLGWGYSGAFLSSEGVV